jgi:hypothetical protein
MRLGIGRILFAVIAWVGIIAVSWHFLVWIMAEHRPSLLNDAEWNEPATARKFHARFPPGSSEQELLRWLARNDFDVDQRSGTARRLIRGLPCNESIRVTWSKSAEGQLRQAEARVLEAGCL